LKLDSVGNLEWQKCLGGTNDDRAYSIRQTKDGGYIVAGNTASFDGDVSGFHGYVDSWIVKLDSSGNIDWEKSLGGTNFDDAKSITQTIEGGYIVAGFTKSEDGDVSENKGYFDYWIVKLDILGNITWEKSLGGGDVDYAQSISQTFDGGYIIAGYTESRDVDVSGNHDYWVVKLSPDKSSLIQADTSDALFSIVAPEAKAMAVDMGEVLVGEIRDSLVVDFVKSKGTFPCRIDSIKIETGNKKNFLAFSSLPIYVDKSNMSHPAEFRFLPDKEGPFSSLIHVYTQAELLTYEIKGVGVKPKLAVDAELLDFGIVELGYSRDTTKVLITNLSDENIEITNSYIYGPDEEQFEILEGGGPFTLAANSDRELKIRFAPKYAGRTSSRIAFDYNGVGSPAIAYLYGAGIGGSVKVTSDSCYAGEKRVFKIHFGGVKLEKFAELVDSYSGILRVEKTLLAPTDATKIYKITDDSTYIEFSGNLDPNNDAIAEIEMIAGLGRVQSTSIDIEEIKWYSKGEEIEYDNENESGMFTLLGVCEEGGERLLNPDGEISMEVMPNPTGDELKVVLNLIEKGDSELIIINSSGEEVYRKTISGKAKNREIKIDLSGTEQGAFFISLQTPTTKIDRSFVRVK
jgi:type IX secretion system substrate protein